MKRKIPCFCENIFVVEVPDEIDLDKDKEYLDKIKNGSFLNYTCTNCGKILKPEFPIMILWPSKNLRFEVLTELDRGEFYRRKKHPTEKKPYPIEAIIGYRELADRIAVIRDGFDPVPIEAIKYYLQLKAEEQHPDEKPEIWYSGSGNGFAEFHIHGIKYNEVAVMKVPLSLYQKTLSDYKKNPGKEVFKILKVRNYLSVKNTMRHETLK